MIWHRLRHYAGLWGFSRRIILQQLLSVAYSALMLSISWFFYRLLRLNCIYISNCYTILLEVVINEWLQSDKKHCLNHFINQAIKKQNKKWILIITTIVQPIEPQVLFHSDYKQSSPTLVSTNFSFSPFPCEQSVRPPAWFCYNSWWFLRLDWLTQTSVKSCLDSVDWRFPTSVYQDSLEDSSFQTHTSLFECSWKTFRFTTISVIEQQEACFPGGYVRKWPRFTCSFKPSTWVFLFPFYNHPTVQVRFLFSSLHL